MSKDKLTDYSVTAGSNTDVGGININTGCDFGNVDNALREILSHLAETNAGTYPVADTWSFGDPADLTKIFRLDAGSITTGTTRVITVPDQNGTMVLTTGAQDLSGKVFVDSSDVSKKLAFTLSGITTATTRTVTWPNASGTVMLTTQYAVLTELQTLGVGSNGQYLKNTSGALSWAAIPATATTKRIYTAGATWSKPVGLVKVIVTVIGGGGGSGGKNNYSGSYSGGGGGSGGASIKEILAASLGATEAVTVGAAGTAGTNAANGGNGGTSSFGAHCSATGGNGGTFANGANGTGGAAGAGSGGLTDITGEIGETGTVGTSTGRGSQGPLGILGAVARTSTGNGNAPPQYSGCGAVAGGHTGATTAQGAAGSIGLVIVEEYFA